MLGPLATFALPVVAMIAFWWEDWPGTRLKAPLSGVLNTALVIAGGVALTLTGQLVVGHANLRGIVRRHTEPAQLADVPGHDAARRRILRGHVATDSRERGMAAPSPRPDLVRPGSPPRRVGDRVDAVPAARSHSSETNQRVVFPDRRPADRRGVRCDANRGRAMAGHLLRRVARMAIRSPIQKGRASCRREHHHDGGRHRDVPRPPHCDRAQSAYRERRRRICADGRPLLRNAVRGARAIRGAPAKDD